MAKLAVVESPQLRVRSAARRALGHVSVDQRIALLVGLAALAITLFRLSAPSLWMDEAFSVALARQPLPVLWSAFSSGSEPNMALYNTFLHFWLQLMQWLNIPAVEFVVRLPSAVFAALSSIVVFLLGLRLLNRTAGIFAAVLYLANPWPLTAAQQSRGYALQLLLICLASYILLAALYTTTSLKGSWVPWVGYVVVSALAVYTHAFSLLIILAQAVAFGLLLVIPTPARERARAHLGVMAASLLAIGLLIAPFLYVSRSGSKTGWLPAPDVASLLPHLQAVILGRTGRFFVPAVIALAALVVLGVTISVVLGRSQILARLQARLPVKLPASLRLERQPAALREPTGVVAILLISWLVVPIVVAYLISQGPTRAFSSRYLVVVVPAVCLLLALGVAKLPSLGLRILLGAALVGATVLTLPGYYAHAEVENWRDPAHWLERTYAPGDGLVCYNNVQGCQLAMSYYLVTDKSAAQFTADTPGLTRLELYGHGDPFATYQDALDPGALASFGARHPRIFFIEARFSDAADADRAHAAQAWLDCRYTYITQTSSNVVTIRLYATTQPVVGTGSACIGS